eukprot:m.125394 g.125394  ORF g.125394 m.125394 type:complete len:114 (+) comp9427_c2_seq1:628-969(+)
MPNLQQPSLIIMDNASYHKTRPSSTPKPHKMNAEGLQAYLDSNNIKYRFIDDNGNEKSQPRRVLMHLVKTPIIMTVPYEVDRIAAKYGHEVLFQPPTPQFLRCSANGKIVGCC